MLSEQHTRDMYDLDGFPLCYEIWHPDSDEYKQLQKEEKSLIKSCKYAKKRIRQLNNKNIILQRQIDQINNDMLQIK